MPDAANTRLSSPTLRQKLKAPFTLMQWKDWALVSIFTVIVAIAIFIAFAHSRHIFSGQTTMFAVIGVAVAVTVVLVPPIVIALSWTGHFKDRFIHAIPYFILILALARGMVRSTTEHDTDSKATSPPKSHFDEHFNEWVDILLLFALTELATLIFDNVMQVRHETARQHERLETAKTSLQLFDDLAQLGPNVRKKVETVVRHWRDLLIHAESLDHEHPIGSSVVRRCIEKVAFVYFDEVRKVRLGELEREELPESVRVDSLIDRPDPKEVAYFTSHVGMYARLLCDLVTEVQESTPLDRKPCLGIITNVLPAHWWNWPIGFNRWYHHKSVAAYRKRLADAAMNNGAWTERLILVQDEDEWARVLRENSGAGVEQSDPRNVDQPKTPWSYPAGPRGAPWVDAQSKDVFCTASPLWPHPLAKYMNDWTILFRDDDRPSKHVQQREYEPYEMLPFLQLFKDKGQLPPAFAEAEFYPMLSSQNNFQVSPSGPYHSEPLLSAYNRVLHGNNLGEGASWYLPISEELFRSTGGFAGYHDVTFVGSVKIDDNRKNAAQSNLWLESATIVGRQWTVAFLASMSPATETIYLTMVQGKALEQLWNKLSEVVKDQRTHLERIGG